jgi:hypothetical protein
MEGLAFLQVFGSVQSSTGPSFGSSFAARIKAKKASSSMIPLRICSAYSCCSQQMLCRSKPAVVIETRRGCRLAAPP